MAQSNEVHTDPPDRFQQSIGNLATAVEDRPPVEVEQAPKTQGNRTLYWLIGGLCTLAIGAAEIGIITHDSSATTPAPPAEVLAALDSSSCAARTGAIVAAVSAYAQAHGSPPPNLAVLNPEYLSFAPIDPVSNQPYGYEVIGQSVSVSCPTAALAPASSASRAPRA